VRNDLTQQFIAQLDSVIAEYEQLISTSYQGDLHDLKPVDLRRLITIEIAAIERIAGRPSRYLNAAEVILANTQDYHEGLHAQHLMGIVQALRWDLDKGHVAHVRELVHADMFADYLDMARYFSDQDYKDAAAVIAGSTLEVHLRELCLKNDVLTEEPDKQGNMRRRKADVLNADLKKNSVYTLNEQKQVTAWLGIRNDSAHGDYNNYTSAEVKVMIQGISSFVVRHPA